MKSLRIQAVAALADLRYATGLQRGVPVLAVPPDTLANDSGASVHDVSADAAREQLARILQSQAFNGTPVLSQMLRYVVDRTLTGKTDELKEYALGVDVFGRGAGFDPRADTIVRVQARRLRSKLEEYYSVEGRTDPVLILLPKGRYVVSFRRLPPPAPAAVEGHLAPPTEATLGRWNKRRLVVTAGSAVLALMTVIYIVTRDHPGHTAGPQIKSLAVLPFDNLSRDPDEEFFSDGLTEEMIAQLGKLNPKGLKVIARGSVAKYKGSSLAANQIGRELCADYLLQGSVRRASDRVRITVQLIQARDQTDLWAESYDRELKDILALQDSVARAIADRIRITLTGDQQTRLANPRTVDPEAYEAYLKGRYYWNKRTADAMQKASVYFQQAIDRDPAYGAAQSGLADCNSGLTWHGFTSPAQTLPRAEAAARKAIETDPQSAEAHASLALVLHHRWDWSGAETEFKRALQLDPQYANAHHWYGDYLSVRGRHDEALPEARQALKLDPLNLMISTWVALRYYLARQYDAAVEQSRSTIELDPDFAAAHLVLGEAYVQIGRYDVALVELQSAGRLSGDSPLYLAQVAVANAAAGRRAEALRIIAQLQSISREQYVSPYGLAQVYAALGDKDQTFRWLQTAYNDRAVWMSYLAVDPAFDRFRSDPRFQDLLQHIGLLP